MNSINMMNSDLQSRAYNEIEQTSDPIGPLEVYLRVPPGLVDRGYFYRGFILCQAHVPQPDLQLPLTAQKMPPLDCNPRS